MSQHFSLFLFREQAVVKTLNLERNQIREISDGDFYGIKIERLLLGNNSLTELKFLSFWGLESSLDTLDLSYNQFRRAPSEALRLLRNLKSLTLTGNHISTLKDFDFGYMRKVRNNKIVFERGNCNLIASYNL